MKILVTGGAGYIGSHTVVELQKQGHQVVIVDNLSNSSADVIDNIVKISGVAPVFEKFDLTDQALTADFFKRHSNIDGIIHFAAFKAVGESVANPLMYYRNNIQSLINILEGMKVNKIPYLVFSSSCTVYGQPDELPVKETSPIKEAFSPYGFTKQVSEAIIRDSVVAYPGIKAIALRYFNPIGAHDSALIGELPLGVPNNLLPFITQTAIGIRQELNVFGSDYNTPDGTAVRDYIHVVDLAQAHVIAVDRMISRKSKAPMEVFNLGTGNGLTVLEVINSFERVSGVKLNYRLVERRPGDVEKVWADTAYANEELGWKAKKAVDEMTLSAWKWELALADRKK
ncbi:MAG TPA: UDP-glucose 4-epimerase GalE [Bacteroidales bacterium]|nr:MAG: UDP-glucose 4-epimerase GalE [Bacteroidetes bacterium GWE2_42_24]OFY31601.1 MAG: UDP-glucose 4-epimerase GalE [Bacteroidetes bacterium GWF2_43_11]HAQ64407.1 UDP-glucose 4-epimerase GalE [Bacteroidales bacterium]HBZ67143.1 UDP-glucose 4-epimerase GalE [Bacteroidales bacterium]